MHPLQKMFPSLALFSDLDWKSVAKEYEENFSDLSFPEYLQEKALEGDSPLYLFELAFYEMALSEVSNSREPYPIDPGIYLNPTALFLSLEFDVKKMLAEAQKGHIEIYERTHVLGLHRDQKNIIHIQELSEKELDLLEQLEDGPKEDYSFIKKEDLGLLEKFTAMGLILDIKKNR